MPIGDSVSQPIPPVGTAGTSYASQLVAFLQEMKSRLENKVALSSLLAGLFDLNNNGLTNASYVGLYEQTTLPSTPVGSLQRFGGELYYVSASGAVRITNGGGLSMTSAQGITGDYGTGPEEFRYDLGALEYNAYSNQAAGEWARVGAQGFDIYGTLAGTTRVRLAWAGGANPSYTLTLPATVPAASSLLVMDTSGNVTTASLSNKIKLVSAAECTWEEANTTPAYYLSPVIVFPGNSTDRIVAPIPLSPGDTITGLNVYLYKGSGTSNTIVANFYKIDKVTGTKTLLNLNSVGADAPGDYTLVIDGDPFTPEVVADDFTYQVELHASSTGPALDSFRCLEIAYNKGA